MTSATENGKRPELHVSGHFIEWRGQDLNLRPSGYERTIAAYLVEGFSPGQQPFRVDRCSLLCTAVYRCVGTWMVHILRSPSAVLRLDDVGRRVDSILDCNICPESRRRRTGSGRHRQWADSRCRCSPDSGPVTPARQWTRLSESWFRRTGELDGRLRRPGIVTVVHRTRGAERRPRILTGRPKISIRRIGAVPIAGSASCYTGNRGGAGG